MGLEVTMDNPRDTQCDRPDCQYGKDCGKATVKPHSLVMRLEEGSPPPGEPIGVSTEVDDSGYACGEHC